MTRKSLNYISVAMLILVTACGGSTTPASAPTSTVSASQTTEVHATGFLFKPDDVTITAGDSITWINDDNILHTITAGIPDSPDTQFDRDLDGRGTSTTIHFDQPGDYTYFCSRHPHMQGVVHVASGG